MKDTPFTQSEISPMHGSAPIHYRSVFLDPTPYYRLEDSAESRAIQRQVNLIFVAIGLVVGAITLGIHVAKSVQPLPNRAIINLKINKFPV
jgi:hypothetical protein